MAAAGSRWFFIREGTQSGPVTWAQLQALARSGRLRANDPVRREGSEMWQPAKSARDVDDVVAQAGQMPPSLPALPTASAVHDR